MNRQEVVKFLDDHDILTSEEIINEIMSYESDWHPNNFAYLLKYIKKIKYLDDLAFEDAVSECMSEMSRVWISKHYETKDYNLEIETPISRYWTNKTKWKILCKQNWKCNICGIGLRWSKNKKYGDKRDTFPAAHVDHIHPFSKRDTYINGIEKINEFSNLQALCPNCNLKKGKKEVN